MIDRRWFRSLDEILSALDGIGRETITAYWDDAAEHVPRRVPITVRLISRSSLGIDTEHVFMVDGDAYDAWTDIEVVPPELWWEREEKGPIPFDWFVSRLEDARWSSPSDD
jgi:hypothetical protein